MVALRVELDPLSKQFFRRLRQTGWVRTSSVEAARVYAEETVKEARPLAPAWTGQGRRRITTKAIRNGYAITSPLYMHVQDVGRKPGARMPPSDALEEWGRSKLGKPGLGFVLARSIARKGIRPKRYLEKALLRARPAARRRAAREMVNGFRRTAR